MADCSEGAYTTLDDPKVNGQGHCGADVPGGWFRYMNTSSGRDVRVLSQLERVSDEEPWVHSVSSVAVVWVVPLCQSQLAFAERKQPEFPMGETCPNGTAKQWKQTSTQISRQGSKHRSNSGIFQVSLLHVHCSSRYLFWFQPISQSVSHQKCYPLESSARRREILSLKSKDLLSRKRKIARMLVLRIVEADT